MSARAITEALMERLERHYIKPDGYAGGILIPECGINGASGSSARCDALYVGFTNASGRLLVGHEVKASRADWLHELAQPGKSDTWADQCHAWYVVAPDTKIVRPEELPDGWGLLTIGRARTRFEVTVKARVHTDRVPSWNAVRSIMARLDTLQQHALHKVHQDANNKIDAKVKEQLAFRAERDPNVRKVADLEALLERVQTATGHQINDWHNGPAQRMFDDDQRPMVTPERLGEALKLLALRDKVGQPDRRKSVDRALEVMSEVQEALTEFRDGLGEFFATDERAAS